MAISAAVYAENAKPFVIPELQEWKGATGQYIPGQDMRIVYCDTSLMSVAEALSDDWDTMLGTKPAVVPGKAGKGDISLRLKRDKTYAAFRLESDTYPGLASRDGYYTKKEFGEFQDEAAGMFVDIIPEIDVPAHTLAFTQYRPELGSKTYGMDHLDLFYPLMYEFFDALFDEYLEGEKPVFRGPNVHIGTDEYSNKDQEVVEKFRELTDHYIRYVERYGKRACVWGSLSWARGVTPVKADVSGAHSGLPAREGRDIQKQGL